LSGSFKEKEIHLYQAKGLWVLSMVIVFVLLLGSLYATWFFYDTSRPIPVVLVIFMMLLDLGFIASLIYGVKNIIDKSPLLIISSEGISGRYILPLSEMLRWEEIDKIFIYPFRFQRIIGIEVKDPESVLMRMPEAKRRMAKWSRNMGYPTFNISTGLFNFKPDEFIEILEKFRTEKLGQNK